MSTTDIELFRGPRALEGRGERRQVRPGDLLVDPAFQEGNVHFLVAGSAVLARELPSGGVLSELLAPGDVVGLEDQQSDQGSCAAWALTTSEIVIMNQATISELIEDDREFAIWVLGSMARRLRRSMDRQTDLAMKSRLAKLLVLVAEATESIEVPYRGAFFSQSTLGQLIGSDQGTVNCSLRRFQRHGWIYLRRDRIVLLRPWALRAYGTGSAGSR
jgi:CRP-like cAMP-binding protein